MTPTGCPCAALKDLGDQLRAERAKREALEQRLTDANEVLDHWTRLRTEAGKWSVVDAAFRMKIKDAMKGTA